VVIDDARAPALLDPLARARDAAARLSRHDEDPDGAVGEMPIRPVLAGDFGETERVGRRAADDRGADRADHAEPAVRRHAAAGDAVQLHLDPRLEPGPEAEEGPERERKEHAVVRGDAR